MISRHYQFKRQYQDEMERSQVKSRKVLYYDRRIVLKNVPQDMTKCQVKKLIEDFEDVNIYMPDNTRNTYTKLVFMDFERSWHAKVAITLINLINHRKISADFAIMNENDNSRSLQPLIERETAFPQGAYPQHGKCAYCLSSKAQFLCKNCFSPHSAAFYCNIDHQSRDWPRHKFDCKPLPKLITPSEAETITEEANEPKQKAKFIVPYVQHFKEGQHVVIVNVQSERILYVRPTHEDFKSLMTSIKELADKSGKLTKKPELNDTVLAPYNGRFCRAQVIDVFEHDEVENDLRCFLLDFGVYKDYNWRNLKKLGYKFRAIPRMTFKVKLDGVKITKHKKEAVKYLEDLKNNESELEVVKEEMRGEERSVVLKLNDETINDEIKKFDKESDNDEPIIFNEEKVYKISTGENIKIKIVDVSLIDENYITCIPFEKDIMFGKINRNVNEYGRLKAGSEVYTPTRPYELCLVQYENSWHRASYGNTNGDECEVVLLDKLIARMVPKEDIRKLPAYLAVNFYTQLCYINDDIEDIKDEIDVKSTLLVKNVEFDEEKQLMLLEGVEVKRRNKQTVLETQIEQIVAEN